MVHCGRSHLRKLKQVGLAVGKELVLQASQGFGSQALQGRRGNSSGGVCGEAGPSVAKGWMGQPQPGSQQDRAGIGRRTRGAGFRLTVAMVRKMKITKPAGPGEGGAGGGAGGLQLLRNCITAAIEAPHHCSGAPRPPRPGRCITVDNLQPSQVPPHLSGGSTH